MDIRETADAAQARALELLQAWFPAGRVQGNEYVLGGLDGAPGRSLSINLKTGAWSDFAAGTKGGDLVALIAARDGISQLDAARLVAGQMGLEFESNQTLPKAREKEPPPEIMMPVDPPPETTPSLRNPRLGDPVMVWRYVDGEGRLLHYVGRYENRETGKKEVLPWVYLKTEKGWRWRSKHPPDPRPLYQLDRLTKETAKAVLVVEGEKTADAAQRLIGPGAIVTTWSGGTARVGTTDWSPLIGRRIAIWPDADAKVFKDNHPKAGELLPLLEQPGMKAARLIAMRLIRQCPSVKLISYTPGERADGWDLADAEAEGWTREQVHEQLSAAQIVQPPAEPETTDGPPPAAPRGKSQQSIQALASAGIIPNAQGAPVACEANVQAIMHRDLPGLVRWDEFRQRVVLTDHPQWRPDRTGPYPSIFSDPDLNDALIWFQKIGGITKASKTMVGSGIQVAARDYAFHPVRDWLEALEWDGTDRINGYFVTYCGATASAYVDEVARVFFLSAVARIFEPGCKMDECVILEGEQGTGKSSSWRALFGDEWFSDALDDLQSKDAAALAAEAWCNELPELSALSIGRVEHIKAWLSRQEDTSRKPYDRMPTTVPRQFVCVGTVNPSGGYLQDATGNRRFLPVATTALDFSGIARDRAQIWAEAVARYRSGENRFFRPELYAVAKDEQSARLEGDVWEQRVIKFAARRETVTTAEVLTDCLEIPADRQTQRESRRVARILRSSGWIYAQRRAPDGTKERAWSTPEDHRHASELPPAQDEIPF